MTIRTWVKRLYIPTPGQADAATRATTLSATLASNTLAQDLRYLPYCGALPCVILDMGTEVVAVVEPTTHAAVDTVQDTMLDDEMPATISRATDVATQTVSAITAHSTAVNPHSITPATIGAAASAHTHTLVDADIPAAIARDAEVAAAYSPTAHNHDTAYSGTAHTHAATGATGGVIRKTAAQTMTATAQTAIADASFAVAVNSKYYFIMYISVTTSTGTSPTTAYGLTGPAGATVAVTLEQDTSTSVEANGVITAFGNFAAGAQVASTGAEVRGVVETAGTAGTVQLTCARAGTTPSMVIPIGGVVGFWMKLA